MSNISLSPRETVLASSAAQLSHTGDTNEHVFATITVPAGAMGINDILEVDTHWSVTNNANAKTCRVRLGGVSGTQFLTVSPASNVQFQDKRRIRNRGALNSQVGFSAGSATAFNTSSGAVVTGAVDMSVAQDIVISAQLGNSGDTVNLESYDVVIRRR